MITLYAFGRVHPGMAGEARDMRVQWALEETGLPYRVHALDYVAGELNGPAFRQLNTFGQVPVIDDDGLVVAESGAIVLYLAQKAHEAGAGAQVVPVGGVMVLVMLVPGATPAFTVTRRVSATLPLAGTVTALVFPHGVPAQVKSSPPACVVPAGRVSVMVPAG